MSAAPAGWRERLRTAARSAAFLLLVAAACVFRRRRPAPGRVQVLFLVDKSYRIPRGPPPDTRSWDSALRGLPEAAREQGWDVTVLDTSPEKQFLRAWGGARASRDAHIDLRLQDLLSPAFLLAVVRGHFRRTEAERERAFRHMWPSTQLQTPLRKSFCLDAAARALDRLRPACVVCYAEETLVNRAFILHCHRRGIPLACVQHGLLPPRGSPHVLNLACYRQPKEPDFLVENLPRLYLVWDEEQAARLRDFDYPADRVRVSGHPRIHGRETLAVAAVAPEPRTLLWATSFGSPRSTTADEARLFAEVKAVCRRHPDWTVLVRRHPRETHAQDLLVAAWMRDAPANLVVTPSSALLEPLVQRSAAMMTFESSVAYDFYVAGKPVVIASLLPEDWRFGFADHRRVWNVAEPAGLESALAAALAWQPDTPGQTAAPVSYEHRGVQALRELAGLP